MIAPSFARYIWKHATVVANSHLYPGGASCYTSPPCPRHLREAHQYRSRLFRTMLDSAVRDEHNRCQQSPL